MTSFTPNIIKCGSKKSTILNITKNIIYEYESFRKNKYFCHYSRKLNNLLINSFHPSTRINSYWKIENMMMKIHKFILEVNPPFMRYSYHIICYFKPHKDIMHHIIVAQFLDRIEMVTPKLIHVAFMYKSCHNHITWNILSY